MAVQVERASAKGFAVRAGQFYGVEPGQVGQLRTPEAWFEVCVARVARLVPSDRDGAVCYIGLQRLGELAVPPDQAPSCSARRTAVSSGTKRSTTGAARAAAILVGLMAAAGPIALAAWSWQSEHPAIRWLSGWLSAANGTSAAPVVDSGTRATTPGPLRVQAEDLGRDEPNEPAPRERLDLVNPRPSRGRSLPKVREP
jgi:hypothetical protein